MTDPDKIYKSNALVDILALFVVIGSAILAYVANDQNWFGVGAGLLAIFALFSLFFDYFYPPKTGDVIHAPNKFARISAGTTGLGSGIYWVLSSWPGLL
ncbi:MAG: hypothetical protein KZQ85_05295 [Candidatus Thiodiazotropha sp. (ex Myrtea sp. 'scaly one' KF741663)]|nr:hypothetical protein [Candidatus Thiodiazotropha sp. (ex Myrtea sp. 'scaly one' KF741663)]